MKTLYSVSQIRLGLERYSQRSQLLSKWLLKLALLNGVLFSVIGLPYLKAILAYGTLYQNKLFDFSSFLGKTLILFYSCLNYFSHFFLLSLLVSAPLILLAWCCPFKRFMLLVGTLGYFISVSFLLIDIYVFSAYHFHLNETLLGFIFSKSVIRTLDMSSWEVMGASLLVLGLFCLEYILAMAAWRNLESPNTSLKRYLLWILSAWLLALFMLLLSMTQKINLFSQQVSNLPLQHQVLLSLLPGKGARRHLYNFSENYYSEPNWESAGKQFNYPLSPLACDKSQFNIILIMVDALRFDVLKKGLMPKLSAFANRGLVFDNHLSGGNATQSGLFSLFYSLPSNYWSFALKEDKPPVFNRELKKQGYDTKVIWSPDMTVPPFHQTIYKGIPLDRVTHQKGHWPSEWDQNTTQEAIHYLENQSTRQTPFYLNVFYRTTHAYCQDNPISQVHQPIIEHCSRLLLNSQTDASPLYHRYQNAVEFIDGELGRLLSKIRQLDLLKTSLVIITSDHGEEFNDTGEGYFGHAGNFSKYQLQVPMIMLWPGKEPKHLAYQTTHYDIVPTLMQSVFHCKTPVADYSVGKHLLEEKIQPSFTMVGSYAFMGWVTPDNITVLRKSGEISVEDKMTRVLYGAKPNQHQLREVLAMMRRFLTDKKKQ